MHVALPILGAHLLMGTDAPKSMGFTVKKVTILIFAFRLIAAPKPSNCSLLCQQVVR